jgi:hypothetical protein
LTNFANFGEPATFVRSPIMMKTPACCVNGRDPDSRRGFGLAIAAEVSGALNG